MGLRHTSTIIIDGEKRFLMVNVKWLMLLFKAIGPLLSLSIGALIWETFGPVLEPSSRLVKSLKYAIVV